MWHAAGLARKPDQISGLARAASPTWSLPAVEVGQGSPPPGAACRWATGRSSSRSRICGHSRIHSGELLEILGNILLHGEYVVVGLIFIRVNYERVRFKSAICRIRRRCFYRFDDSNDGHQLLIGAAEAVSSRKEVFERPYSLVQSRLRSSDGPQHARIRECCLTLSGTGT